jgi:hypothetical protein
VDSRPETLKHIDEVQTLMKKVINNLKSRAENHDKSKLESPEVEVFDQCTGELKDSKYGSPEYLACLERMKPALQHHYSKNDHHAEFFRNGMADMNLLQVLEMICDWTAATKRHNTGDIRKSIEINQKRFGYPDYVKKWFLNTIDFLEN